MAGAEDTLEFRGRLTLQDARSYFYFSHLRSGGWLWIPVTTICLLVFDWVEGWGTFTGFYAVIAMSLCGYVYGPIAAARAITRNHETGDELRYRVDADGIHMHEDGLSLSVAWSACGDVFETKRLFVIALPHGMSHQIPKRFFSGASDTDRFRALLVAHIPAGNFKPASRFARWF